MKLRLYISLVIISILLFSKVNFAQDFQLSQYDANPLYINPALTGLRLNEDWDYRLSINYRDQKGNTGKSNKTFASGFDMPFNNRFSFGEFIINNNSINNSLNTFNFMLSGAYKITHKNKNGYDKHNLSVGLQAGLLQQSFNQNNFSFDSQYSSTSSSGFDTNLSNGENFTKTNTFNVDANIGMYYRFIDKNKKYSPFGGFSIYHLTRPDQSYTSSYSQTPLRMTLQGGCLYTFNETFSVLPQFLFMQQAGINNLNVGIMGYEKIKDTDYQPMLGVSWRNTDAVIIHAGLKYRTYTFRVSYDINTNYMHQFGNRGVEVSLVFTFKKKSVRSDSVAVLIPSPNDISKANPKQLTKPSLLIEKNSVNPTVTEVKQPSSDSLKKLIDNVNNTPVAKPQSTVIKVPEKLLQSDSLTIKKKLNNNQSEQNNPIQINVSEKDSLSDLPPIIKLKKSTLTAKPQTASNTKVPEKSVLSDSLLSFNKKTSGTASLTLNNSGNNFETSIAPITVDSEKPPKTSLPPIVSDSLINIRVERILFKDSTYRYNWLKLLYYQFHLGKRARNNSNVNDK